MNPNQPNQNEIARLLRCLSHGIKSRERYPEIVRKFCCSIHYHSPAAYRVVRSTFGNNLPHPHTIASWYRYSNINGCPGFHSETFERLKKIADDVLKTTGKPLVCSLIVDEMYIKKQIRWCNQSQQFLGHCSYGAKQDDGFLPVANQAIVFFLNGINQQIEFPLGYHFIKALTADDKANLYTEVINKVSDCAVIINNVTFDGLSSNFAMCRKLGANLNIFSDEFQPFILNPLDNSRIFIIFDSCHLLKLVRNTLGNKGTIFDDNGERVKWNYIVKLLEFSEKNNIHTHKLSRKHIEFKSSIMNVRIAAETLSQSVADSLEFMLNKGVSGFQSCQSNIRFNRFMNSLFDIFNSMAKRDERDMSDMSNMYGTEITEIQSRQNRQNGQNVLKRPLNAENKAAVFSFLDEAENYIKSLKITTTLNGKTKRMLVTKTRNSTGFKCFIINIAALKQIYQYLVEEKQYIIDLPTYLMSQDFLERFFGKLRSFHGFNNNPDVICFQSAYIKLCSGISISPPLASNSLSLQVRLSTSASYSDLFHVSSRRHAPIANTTTDSTFLQKVDEEKFQIYSDITRLEEIDRSYYLIDGFAGASIAYASHRIEDKIKSKFICEMCQSIFETNEKFLDCCWSKTTNKFPCRSTYEICATTDKFLRTHKWNDQSDYKIKYFLIYQELDFENLYTRTSFVGHDDHKFHLIKTIINEYSRLRGNQLSKKITIDEMPIILRKRLNKLILRSGQ